MEFISFFFFFPQHYKKLVFYVPFYLRFAVFKSWVFVRETSTQGKGNSGLLFLPWYIAVEPSMNNRTITQMSLFPEWVGETVSCSAFLNFIYALISCENF